MIGIKIAAIAVAALGGAAVGSDVYLSTHERTALHSSWPKSVPAYDRATNVAPDAVPGSTRMADRTVFIEPLTIHSNASYQHAFAADALRPAGSLAPCVDWGLSRSPAERGLWTVCFADSRPVPSQ